MHRSAPSPRLPTLVFDLDGTLADTAADLIETLNVVLIGQTVAPVATERARDVVGAGARAMIQRGLALGGRTVPQDVLDKLFVDFLSHYAQNLAVKTKLFPGVVESLDRLAAAGHGLAVCTNKVEAHSVILLEALGIANRFAAIAGRDTFAFCKPDGRHIAATVTQAGGDPTNAIMVGDSRADVDAARDAGIPVIGVTFGYTDIPVASLGPDRVIDHFDQLEAAVASLAPARSQLIAHTV